MIQSRLDLCAISWTHQRSPSISCAINFAFVGTHWYPKRRSSAFLPLITTAYSMAVSVDLWTPMMSGNPSRDVAQACLERSRFIDVGQKRIRITVFSHKHIGVAVVLVDIQLIYILPSFIFPSFVLGCLPNIAGPYFFCFFQTSFHSDGNNEVHIVSSSAPPPASFFVFHILPSQFSIPFCKTLPRTVSRIGTFYFCIHRGCGVLHGCTWSCCPMLFRLSRLLL